MPDPALMLLFMVVAAALAFDYINGFHDTANAIATCVSTRALSVKAAIFMADARPAGRALFRGQLPNTPCGCRGCGERALAAPQSQAC